MAKKNELIANSKILSLLDKESKLNFSDNKVKLEYSKILSISQEPDLNINQVKLENSKILSISQEPDPIPSDNNNNTYNYYQVVGPKPYNMTEYSDIFSPPFGSYKITDKIRDHVNKGTTVNNGNSSVVNIIQNIENNENKEIILHNNSLGTYNLIQNIRNNKNCVINNNNSSIKNVIQNIENNDQVIANNNHISVENLTQNIKNNDKVLKYNNCLDKDDYHIQNQNIFLHQDNAIILGKDGIKKYLPDVENLNLFIRNNRSYVEY